MKAVFAVFPKYYAHLSVEQLADLVRATGLDTTTVVIREGYWVTHERLREQLPAFVKAIRRAGVNVHWATAGFMPAALLDDPTPLAVLADCGLTHFRMGQYWYDGPDVRGMLATAREELQRLVPLCLRHRVRCVYQLHHNSLIASPSAAWEFVRGLPPEAVGVMLDPGNQARDGLENWRRSARLLGEYLTGLGAKDVVPIRDPAAAAGPGKGWQWTWAPLYEGLTDWHEVMGALAEVGFDGTFVFMPFYNQDDPAETTRKLKLEAAYLRNIVAGARGK